MLKLYLSHEFKWIQSSLLNGYVWQSMPTCEAREKVGTQGNLEISMIFKAGMNKTKTGDLRYLEY